MLIKKFPLFVVKKVAGFSIYKSQEEIKKERKLCQQESQLQIQHKYTSTLATNTAFGAAYLRATEQLPKSTTGNTNTTAPAAIMTYAQAAKFLRHAATLADEVATFAMSQGRTDEFVKNTRTSMILSDAARDAHMRATVEKFLR